MINIGFDFDGVLCYSVPFLIRFFHDKYGFWLTDNKPKFHFDFPPEYDIRKVRTDIAEAILKYNKHMTPHKDAVTGLHNIVDVLDIERVKVVSARHPSTEIVTKRWLEKWFPSLQFETHIINRGSQKRKACEELNITHFVEDRYKTVLDLAKTLNTVFIYDAVYNERPVPDNVIRVSKLNDVAQWLLKRRKP